MSSTKKSIELFGMIKFFNFFSIINSFWKIINKIYIVSFKFVYINIFWLMFVNFCFNFYFCCFYFCFIFCSWFCFYFYFYYLNKNFIFIDSIWFTYLFVNFNSIKKLVLKPLFIIKIKKKDINIQVFQIFIIILIIIYI